MRIIRTGLLVAATAAAGLAQSANPVVLRPIHSDVSRDLISMMLSRPQEGVVRPSEVIQKHDPLPEDLGSALTPTVNARLTPAFMQDETVATAPFAPVTGANFDGLGTGTPGYVVNVAPPDTTLAVGPNHVVQWVNVHLAIYNKAGLPQLPAPGFVAGNTLWTGFGGVCETTNRGDVLVAYDRAADRWVFSQFAFGVAGGNPAPPFLQCFAVSTGANPAGPYFRYSYDYSAAAPGGGAAFNDYGKLGVWPDAYYMTYNMFSGGSFAFIGVGLCAFDRTAMLAGAATATQLCAPISTYAGGGGFLPADLDGATTPPPAGTPNFMARLSFANPPSLRVIKFKVNSFNPPNFTFNDGFGGAPGSFVNIPVGALVAACNGSGGSCVQQPGTFVRLDTLGDRLMYRLAYRNRGGTESLMTSIATDPDGGRGIGAAVRWFEVRSPNANPPVLFQNSTFNPNATNRWMSSIAMDKNGNMGLGYSVASRTVSPGVRMTGRLATDPVNTMQAEAVIVNGAGSQTGNLTRWGDYSTMRVDPADDCTFWFSTEYMGATGSFNWRTRINSSKFSTCQ